MQRKKVKIVSDGSSLGTVITDLEGKPLNSVKAVKWEVVAGEPAKLTLSYTFGEFVLTELMEAEIEPYVKEPNVWNLTEAVCKVRAKLKELEAQLKELEWLESLKQQTEIKPL